MKTSPETVPASKQKLIEATIDLMTSKGFESTGINEILARAGVTKSNFYYHFKSKEALCLAALDAIIDHYTEEVVRRIFRNRELTPQQRIESFSREVARKMTDNGCTRGCTFVNLASETSDFYPSFRERIERFFRRYMDTLESCYQEGVETGQFRDDIQPDKAAKMMIAHFHGTMVLTKNLKIPTIIEENMNTLLIVLQKRSS